ncbi:MAG: AI-2E family transporter YdiK [Nitrospira sp.]|nr:MAG: AI-2E family transporter YdiK [Nitrospira sp.]
MAERQFDLTRDTLAVVFLFALIAASVWILWPFLAAVVWATMIVVATWPFLLTLQRWLLGKRWLAVTGMTLLLLAIFVLPFSFAVVAVAENFNEITAWTTSLAHFVMPLPPDWLGKIPLVGARMTSSWHQFAAMSPEELATRLSPYLGVIMRWLAGQIGSLGLLLAHIALMVIIAAVLYATGESAAAIALRFGSRLAGQRGEHAVQLAGQAIRSVALGVVVTALVQALAGGIGLAIVGVPFVVMLTAVMFILAIVQVGVAPVLLPAVAWLYWTGDTTWGTVLLVWTILVLPIDNFLRPVLIKQGVDLPMLLVIAGVVGGLLAFGLIGIFVGPVVLAVAYTLFTTWIEEDEAIGRTNEKPRTESP